MNPTTPQQIIGTVSAGLAALLVLLRIGPFLSEWERKQTTSDLWVTPAMGLLVASMPMIYWYGEYEFVATLLLNKWFLYAITILLSWLMVSNIPMMAMKFKNFSVKSNLPKLILLIIAVIAVIFLHWIAVPVIFIAYILLSLIYKNS